MVNSFLFFFR